MSNFLNGAKQMSQFGSKQYEIQSEEFRTSCEWQADGCGDV